jgi:succinate-semialdehyde dehydrogenase/glutarate-semialdehyde dehydrogenase
VPYRSANPATVEVLKTFTEHTDQEMMDALATADKAFVSWAALPINERAKIISHPPQLLLERKSELAKLATLEMGMVALNNIDAVLNGAPAPSLAKSLA